MYKIIPKALEMSSLLEIDQVDFEYKHKNKIFVYKRSSGTTYAFLTKLYTDTYGWVAIGHTDTWPTYIASSLTSSLELVSNAKRDIRIFDSMEEFIGVRKSGKF